MPAVDWLSKARMTSPSRKPARLKPESEIAHVSLGIALASAGRPDEAIRQLTEALRINPKNPTARPALDNLLKRGKNP